MTDFQATVHAYDPSVMNCSEHDMGDCPYHVDDPCQVVDEATGVRCDLDRLNPVHGDPAEGIIIAWVNDDVARVYAAGRLVEEVDWDGYGSTMPRALNVISQLAAIYNIPIRIEGEVGRS